MVIRTAPNKRSLDGGKIYFALSPGRLQGTPDSPQLLGECLYPSVLLYYSGAASTSIDKRHLETEDDEVITFGAGFSSL